ncbi:MAG TPA: bifunctional DNA primase/polymerase [Streptosporangiaceae bacterium]|nr:bifunctional DNA primase/polymerase [Streptosporangiaceae bacterium]
MVEAVLRVRRRKTEGRLADAAIRYAAMGWPVCAGAFPPSRAQRPADVLRACSCDRVGCPSPGAHPLSPAWQMLATTDPDLVTRWWLAMPDANVVLPTGRVFDVLDVPAGVGVTALSRMERSGVRPGPVAISAGNRAYFFVLTRGAPVDESEWWSCHLDCEPEEMADVSGLRWHCRDSYVLAPPSRNAGAMARWLRHPASFELPDGLRLLEVLADACEEAG